MIMTDRFYLVNIYLFDQPLGCSALAALPMRPLCIIGMHEYRQNLRKILKNASVLVHVIHKVNPII